MKLIPRKTILLFLLLAGVGLAFGQVSCGVTPENEKEKVAETVGATDDDSAAEPLPNPLDGPKLSPSFDLAGIIEQVHFAFRWEEDSYVGGHTTYGVWVTPEGEITFLPGIQADNPADDQLGAPLVLQTVRVSRGKWSERGPADKIEYGEKQSLALRRGAATEGLSNRAEGLEQSWSFATPPPGSGDLRVEVRVSGQTFAGASETGLHFFDEVGGLGVAYSLAVWRDGTGRETIVEPRFQHGRIVLTVPAEVLAESTYPAVLDPTVSPEFSIDNPVYPPLEVEQNSPGVAFNGSEYFVAWHDRRLYSFSGYDIYGTRVNTAGGVLDPDGIAITNATNTQYYPSVTSDGSNFLVVWQDSRYGTTDVFGARVSSAGTVLDTSGLLICVAGGQQEAPDAAFDGINYLVVWHDNRVSYPDIYGNRVTTAGVNLDASGFVIAAAGGNQKYPAIAFDGVNYLVVWQDTRNFATTGEDIYGARVNPSAVVIDSSGIPISTADNTQDSPDVAFGGSNYFVVWRDARSGNNDIYGSRVNMTGNVLDSSGVAIATTTEDQSSPAVATSGSDYLAVWKDQRNGNADIYGARISGSGTVIDPSGLAISTATDVQDIPAVAYDSTEEQYLVVWHDRRNASTTDYDIYGAIVSTDGDVYPSQGFIFSTKRPANQEQQAALAYDGANYLAVWRDQRYGEDVNIYGARLTATGVVLDPAGIAISRATNTQEYPTVVFGGSYFLVVWQDKRSAVYDIYGARVATDGTVADPSGILISDAVGDQLRPAAAEVGGVYLATWQDQRNANYDIYGAQLNQSGTVLQATGIPITTNAGAQEYPAVAADGSQYFVAWQDIRGGNYDIYGARVSAAGSVLDASGIVLCGASGAQTVPAATYNEVDFVVVWQDTRGTDSDLYGGRVTSGGTALDGNGFVVVQTTGVQENPAVAFDGYNSVVAWGDYRSGKSDIYAAWVSPNAVVLPTGGSGVATDTGSKLEPAVASSGGGYSLVMYHKANVDSVMRLLARRVWWLPTGLPCTAATDCISGYCADGFCCDTACGGSDATDCQVCSATLGASADGTCTPLPTTHLCRAATGICDLDEFCDGASGACPTNTYYSSTTVCRAATDLCDAVEYCTGSGANCPADALLASTSICRAGTDLCDQPELCTGSSKACPADQVYPSTHECRGVAGDCDVAELCDGSTKTCPSDSYLPTSSTCRNVAGPCDVAENCPGDGPDCPIDLFLDASTSCRNAAGLCDRTEYCPGDAAACPADAKEPTTTECRPATDLCDVGEFCDGATNNCPTDAVAPTTTECRPSVGDCDAAEFCDGTSKPCPADQLEPDTTICRPSVGSCDVADHCTGALPDCPADELQPDTYPCRDAVGLCDQVEYCPGDATECPADLYFSEGYECRPAAGLCDRPETCSGDTPDCPGDVYTDDATVCRPAADICDREEICPGDSPDCPADGYQSETTECRPEADLCDAAEFCTGTGITCPADLFKATTEICRDLQGPCDLVEYCAGDSAACPADLYQAVGETCRPVAGKCDIAEVCTGDSFLCPTDEFQAVTVECRHAAHECDAGEFCPGDGPKCPPDTDLPDGERCDDGIYCNGFDTCVLGGCVEHAGDPCYDNLYCNGEEICDEESRQCNVENIPECPDDGLWCNGEEYCNEEIDDCDHSLTPGTRCPDDGVFCNGPEACDEETQTCYHSGNPCADDGQYCNGLESCDEEADDCTTTGNPCQAGEVCLEAIDTCVQPEDTSGSEYDPNEMDMGCGC
ncbi:MAG: hypothetical protein GX444_01330 [Myxococcales bacterium]|nr:hypothetical protein [Myxococcales bacterium]